MAISMSKEVTDKTRKIEERCKRCRRYNEAGDYFTKRRNAKKANKYYYRALKILDELESETEIEDHSLRLNLYKSMGKYYLCFDIYDKAKDFFDEYLQLLIEENGDKKESIAANRELESEYQEISCLFRDNYKSYEELEGNNYLYLEAAYRYLERAVKIEERIAEYEATEEAWESLADIYESALCLSDCLEMLEDTVAYCEKFLQIREIVAKKEGSAQAYKDLADGYLDIADKYSGNGKYEEAKYYYEKALETSIALAEGGKEASEVAYENLPEEELLEVQLDIGDLYSSLGDISVKLGKSEDAKAYFLKAFATYEVLAEERENVEARVRIVQLYIDLIQNCVEQGKMKEAEEHYLKALQIGEKLVSEVNDISNEYSIARICMDLADFSSDLGYLEEAKNFYRKRIQLTEKIHGLEFDLQNHFAYLYIGRICEEQGNLNEAKEVYKESLRKLKKYKPWYAYTDFKREVRHYLKHVNG